MILPPEIDLLSNVHLSSVVLSEPRYRCAFDCELPARNASEARQVLEVCASGAASGAWRNLEIARIADLIRDGYKAHLEHLDTEISAKYEEFLAGRMTKEQFARWASAQRTRGARYYRLQTLKKGAPIAAVLPEIRDQFEYGLGGRNFSNLVTRTQEKLGPGASREQVYDRIIKGATKPNAQVSLRVNDFVRYMETGKPLIFARSVKISPKTALRGLGVIGVATGAYDVITAPPAQRGEVARRIGFEFGGAIAVSEVGIASLVAFTATPFGWVIAAGIILGVGGSVLGGRLHDKIFYSNSAESVHGALQRSGAIEQSHLQSSFAAPHGAPASLARLAPFKPGGGRFGGGGASGRW
ncbi:hypothetical protein [Sorangium sp. So ce117]|uniref:hypothetical protein n=1 Tax=Sorangium sp. So ce117 TaxID=3133277 RepID=UPI003F5D83ED